MLFENTGRMLIGLYTVRHFKSVRLAKESPPAALKTQVNST